MRQFPNLIQYIIDNSSKLFEQTWEHIGLTFISLLLAVLIAVPVGIWITRKPKLSSFILGFAGILQTIPSIALLGFMIPLLGIGVKPAIFALFIYALLPIIRNTYTGIQEVEEAVVDAAKGIGMTSRQILRSVELPLAMPVIFAGIRTATVINVGVATLAAYIGAGGLGEFIFGGIALNNSSMILAGAIPAAILAVFFDQVLAGIQKGLKKGYRKVALSALLFIPLLGFFSFSDRLVNDYLTVAVDPEFYGRDDGYPALQKQYGLSLNTVLLNASLMYEAIRTGEVDLIAGYSTDGRIRAYDLVSLEDDQNAFPPYQCAAVVNNRLFSQFPKAVEALNLLTGQINDSLITGLNFQVDHLEKPIEVVAKEFLQSRDLWKEDNQAGGPLITIGSKLFSENYLMAEMFGQIIECHTHYTIERKHGLGGTKICFDALRQEEIDIYPGYTGTGFQVMLSPTPEEVQDLIDDVDGVYQYVQSHFRDLYQVHWLNPVGFNNTYAMMAPRAEAERRGWQKVSDLID